MKNLLLGLTLLCAGLPTLHAQDKDLNDLLEGLNIELDDDTCDILSEWIKSIENIDFEWTDDFTKAERRKIGRRYEPLITVRSDEGQHFYVYGGRKKGVDELLVVAQMESNYIRVSLTGDFDFR